MKTSYFAVAMVTIALGLCGSVACGKADGSAEWAFTNGADAESDLQGTWEYNGGDAGGQQKITLILRSDHSYTKTLEAHVQGANYGGTHSGTWTADGKIVHLSGDENWPPYTHDLSLFRKVR
jgi:hypothetical protein